ncbi:kinase-like protein [Rozella allomycis CSF55]|uniref:Kinase-like protein n=1 Tax=Rozella allomycis (strain CSF55) TaxID=988480 RepID=A0A4P9YHU7_ROZAC|nr:kinase-like protein [Rozella allomycis CSF55]
MSVPYSLLTSSLPTTTIYSNEPLKLPETNELTIILISSGASLFFIIIVALIFFYWRHRKNKKSKISFKSISKARLIQPSRISLSKSSQRSLPKIGLLKPTPLIIPEYHRPHSNALDSTTITDVKSLISLPGQLQIDIKNDIEIEELIGKGGFAKVYKARLVKPIANISVVAIKMFSESEAAKSNLSSEIALHSSLKHSNIAQFIGFAFSPPSIILKYYNVSLIELIRTKPQYLTANLCLDILIDICKGMEYLHANSLLDNILLNLHSVPGDGIIIEDCVVSDFGLARVIDSFLHDKLVSGLSTSTAAGLTLAYASPELIRRLQSHETVVKEDNKPVDVYAFSILMYELIYKKNAWDVANLKNTQEFIRDLLIGLRPKIDDEYRVWNEVIINAWSADHTRRKSFHEILTQLELLKRN